MHNRTPDPARFFTTDSDHGALLDRDGDRVPDDLRARLLVAGEPGVAEWCALIDLAARLGLELGALTLPFGLAAPAELPAGARALVFVADGAAESPLADDAWVLRGAAEVRALLADGLVGDEPWAGAEPDTPPAAPLDLARLFETDGLLRDDDGDLVPDRVALAIVLARPPAVAVGLALCDLAARLGLESAGLRLPLAVPFGAALPPDAVPLVLAAPRPGLARPAPGEALCAVVPDEQGRPSLLVAGDDAATARLLRALAATWPHPRAWDAGGPTVADHLDALAATLHGEDAAGRAALLAADLAALGPATAPGELRLLDADPALRAAAAATIAHHGLPLTLAAAPDDRLAFTDEWADEWEVDRARRLVRERVLPAFDPTRPVELLALVSEPPAIRRALADEWRALLPPGSTVRVRCAFKAGLSWLTEEVAPAWAARGDVARVELRYRPFAPPEDRTFLDLPIRWLQELYPGDELLAAALGLPVAAIELVEDAGLDATYVAVALDATGGTLAALPFSPRSYTLPYLADAPAEGSVVVTTGGIAARQDGRILCDADLPTDLDRFWAHYQGSILPRVRALIDAATGGTPTAADQPFFAALDIHVWCSEPNESLGLREELLSSAEALHEDLYFGTLDAIAAMGNAAPAAGTLGPGQRGALDAPGAIRPFVHVAPGAAPRARITLRRRPRHLADLAPAADPTNLLPLGALPTGPRPNLALTWLTSRAGTPGFARLGVALAGGDGRAGAVLRASAGREATGGQAIGVEVEAGGETVVLEWAAAGGTPTQVGAGGPRPPSHHPQHPLRGVPGARKWTADGQGLPDGPIAPDQLPDLLSPLSLLPSTVVRRVGRSYEGREIGAIELVRAGNRGVWSRRKLGLFKPTLLVIARHHANEPASTHAALALARRCASDPDYARLLDRVNVAIVPLANPDGAALHALMAAEHPTWKHHAARYNAVGREFGRDHFDPDTPWGESRVYPRLWREWLPDVIADNHGVPSHEWAQPFAGFGSPPRFGVSYWLVSALIYGILHYPTDDPAHAAAAEALRDRVAAAVAADPALRDGNAARRAVYERWGHSRVPARFPATYHREMLWYFGPASPESRQRFRRPAAFDRVTAASLVTEVPDETAQGDELRLVARAHLVANRAILDLLAEAAPPVGRAVATGNDGARIVLRRPRPLALDTAGIMPGDRDDARGEP